MKLLYLYIEKHNCIEDQEFNFDSNYRFRLDRSNPQEWELKDEKVNNPLPDDVSAPTNGKHNVGETVSAIVGENGSGKTSLINFLCDYISYPDMDKDSHNTDKRYLVIFKRTIDNPPECWTNFDGIKSKTNYMIHDIKKDKQLLGNYLSFVYYSPFFTTEHIFHTNRNASNRIDISTSALLTPTNSNIKFMQSLAYYKSEEYKHALVFLAKYRDVIKEDKIQKTLPEPKGILITIDVEYALEFLTSLTENYGNRHIESIMEREKVTDIIRKELAKSLLKLYDRVKDSIFLLLFWCYVISFWRRYNSPKNRSKISIVEKYNDFIKTNSLYKISEEDACKRIQEFVHDYDEIAHDFFESFGNFLFLNELKTIKQNDKNIEIECDFSKINDIKELKDRLFDLVNKYYNIPLRNSFVLFGFTPNISSGEMSFLTIFSRILDCISNNEKVKNKNDIILFLDEVETTLHPEWQRRLVLWIINFLEDFVINKKVHIIFASHSPILLSDIPDSNVVFLKKDIGAEKSTTVDHKEIGKTFGSNIYTLYKKSFFLNNGLLGEFAEQKIEDIIKDLLALELKVYSGNRENRYQELKQEIELIGEPVIRNQLKDRLNWVRMRNSQK